MKLTRRAALRATEDVGRKGRTVNEVAEELGCDWQTVNDTVLAYEEALVDHPGRSASPSEAPRGGLVHVDTKKVGRTRLRWTHMAFRRQNTRQDKKGNVGYGCAAVGPHSRLVYA